MQKIKKYKLLKDLPDYKAGTVIVVDSLYSPIQANQDLLLPDAAIYKYSRYEIVTETLDSKKSDWFEEIKEEVEPPESWQNIEKIEGYAFGVNNWILPKSDFFDIHRDAMKDVFRTENQAKAALAMAQLSQLMAHPAWNGDWKCDWNSNKRVGIISPNTDGANLYEETAWVEDYRHFLVFKDGEEAARKFYEMYKYLVDDYFLLFR